MSSLYLFQFAALIFMLVNALFVALARLTPAGRTNATSAPA